MSKVLVFDIDDTISIHTNRDYVNAKPVQPVIDKLNRLHDEGYYIKLFTGRGQVSCNGDLNLIIERNKDVLETWLKKHGVKYDELIFGKPLGDWYIDDKGMSVKDFLKADFYELKGGSNSSIRRELNKVIKTAKNSQSQYAWYKYVNNYYKTIAIPIVYSCVVDTMYMEYIDGINLVDNCTKKDIEELVAICYLFKQNNSNDIIKGDLDSYCDNLKHHINNSNTLKIIKYINNHKWELSDRMSFYHGDLTLSNVIKRGYDLVLIDPNYKDDYRSYILDLAKIRQSLHDYEYMFGFSNTKNSNLLEYFDNLILPEDRQFVKLMEITHWIRMYSYKSDEDKLLVNKMINRLIGEYDDEYQRC